MKIIRLAVTHITQLLLINVICNILLYFRCIYSLHKSFTIKINNKFTIINHVRVCVGGGEGEARGRREHGGVSACVRRRRSADIHNFNTTKTTCTKLTLLVAAFDYKLFHRHDYLL